MRDGSRGVPVWVWIVAPAALGLLLLFVLGPLAAAGLRRYIGHAKQAEARAALVAWGDALVRCGDRDGALPPSSAAVPASLSQVAGKKFQSAPADWSETAHTCGGFRLSSPQYFQYSWELRAPTDGMLHARADLDGDGSVDTVLDLAVTCVGRKCLRGAPVAGEVVTSATIATQPSARDDYAELDGRAIDLSTVMGKARRLANAWQRDAALLGVRATLFDGRIQTQDGATAEVRFGPAPFGAAPANGSLFIVSYDRGGLHGAPSSQTPGKALPEPMCAPEAVLRRLTEFTSEPVTLSYGFDGSDRPAWLMSLPSDPKPLRAFAPDSCETRGTFIARPKH